MGKSKKKKRNDARGYGGGKGPQGAPSQLAASSKDVVVTKQTHEGIQSLVDKLRSSEIEPTYQKVTIAATATKTSAPVTADSTIRFVPKLSKIIDRLIDLGFKYDPSGGDDSTIKKNSSSCLEDMVRALGYGITLESALDWLCLSIPTLELPPLFTDGNLRNNLMQQERQGISNASGNDGVSSSSLTVLKFVSSSSSSSQPIPPTENEKKDIKKKELERQQQEERMKKIQEEKKIAKEKAEAEEREAAKKKLLEQYAEYHDDSDSDEGQGDMDTNVPKIATPLSPQEAGLMEKEKELNELETDLGCEANNYMRSKQEMKIMRNQAKKLKQQVAGLRRKVENIRRQREKEEEERRKAEEPEEEENGMDILRGVGFFGNEEEEEEEEENTEENADIDHAHAKGFIDCPIPKGWTGTTPRKTLEDTCRKQRLGKPKFLNLGAGSSGGYKLSGINVQRAKKAKSSNSEDISTKDEWIALTSDFSSGSSLPDYLALQALYEFDSNKPLYGMFPPAFRSIWLSWLEEVQQQNEEVKQSIQTKKNARIEKLLGIIEANHRTEVLDLQSKNTNTNNKLKPTSLGEKNDMDEDGQHNTLVVEESWEDMDDDVGDNHISDAKNPSKAGRNLKREFLQRQSTKTYVEMLHQRENLPMTSYRSEVLETIEKHQVIILCAETVRFVQSFQISRR